MIHKDDERDNVLRDCFELFLKCSQMPESNIEKLLKAVDNKDLSAVGFYIEDDGYRIAEVEFEIDWDEHQRMIGVYGIQFDTDLPGWDDGVSPEAYIAAQRLVKAAKQMRKPVLSWIRVSPSVRNNPATHKAVCDNLGFGYGRPEPPWKNEPIGRKNISYFLEENSDAQPSEDLEGDSD